MGSTVTRVRNGRKRAVLRRRQKLCHAVGLERSIGVGLPPRMRHPMVLVDGRLIQADTLGATHLPHQLGHVDTDGAGVRGPDPEASVVRDHLGQDVQDRLSQSVSTEKKSC